MKYNNIKISKIDHIENCGDLSIYDVVYSPSTAIDVSLYPGVRFIFGPHFSIFPEESHMIRIKGSNSVYVQPSQWPIDLWKIYDYCSDLNMKVLPFGVDTDRFSPSEGVIKNNVLIYFKRRNPDELRFIESVLKSYQISYRIFGYGSYNEADYLDYLRTCKFGIWLDAHESQGFALEEALSLDVPLLVWNVRLFSQEYGSSYPNIFATTIPYWDSTCGEVVYTAEEFGTRFPEFLSKLGSYRPREFVIKELSIDICQKRFIECFFN